MMMNEKLKRGTAAMDLETRTRVASAGGRAVSQNKKHMSDIGARGGKSILAQRGAKYFSELGKKGGAAPRAAISKTMVCSQCQKRVPRMQIISVACDEALKANYCQDCFDAL